MTAEPTTPAPLDPARTATLLDAGAILAPGTASGDDVDTLTVRTYTHGALGDRRIVRLVPGTLGAAEDLALDFLGLSRDGDAPEVGHVRRETLGFPAWALVNDPANGHHALALVRDLERLDRQARSKPGAAKEGFDALGTTLGRAVPHFLPTFYEQAARIFLAHENTTYAATFFNKARQAERVHNLPVEEARLRSVFLEFAFAGALTAKALKEYAKDLARRLTPEAAWAEFRQLCVERCAAGMPPYAGLAEDARSMIKSLGGGTAAQAAAERHLLADLLPSGAIGRSPLSFWKTFAKALAALAEERPDLRARLLDILPRPSSGDAATVDAYWLTLLTATGAETLLTTPGALEPGRAAAWLTAWSKHISRGWRGRPRDAATLALAARMAPAIAADGAPVDPFNGNARGDAAADFVDVCLAHGIPLVDPDTGGAGINLGTWYSDGAPGRRDLVAVGADPRYTLLLRDAVGRLGTDGSGRHLPAAAAHPVLRVAMHDWLAERAAELVDQSGLPGAQTALDRISPFRAVAADVNPEVVARVRAFDPAPILGRTLRAGILDELGWPTLDEALRLLGATAAGPFPGLTPPDADAAAKLPEVNLFEAWPALILATTTKVVVAGPDGILLDHDLRIPDKLDGWMRPKYRFVDGDLLVMWWADDTDKAYWSSRPADVFTPTGDVPGRWSGESLTVSVPHPRGGRVTGGRTLHAGDTVVPMRRPVLTDGVGYWLYDWQQSPSRWVEYDPDTGTRGRASLPAFFEAAVADGGSLRFDECELLPLQPGLEGTPFGTDGRLLGRWIRDDGQTVTAGVPGGDTATLPGTERRWGNQPRVVPVGGLRLPGARPTIGVSNGSIETYDGAVLTGTTSVGGRGGLNAAGTALVTPLAYWHALRPRDEASSAVLRAVTDTDAAALLTAAAEEYAAARAAHADAEPGTLPPDPVPLASVGSVLPAIARPEIAAGVAGITWLAAKLARDIAVFGTEPVRTETAEDQDEYRPVHGDDYTVNEASVGLSERRGHNYSGSTKTWQTLNHIRAVAAVLAAEAEAPEAPESSESPEGAWTTTQLRLPQTMFDWTASLGDVTPLLARAASPLTTDEHREALCLLAEEVTADVFRQPGRLRRVLLLAERRDASRIGQLMRHGDRVVLITHTVGWAHNNLVRWMALDLDPSGRFGAVDGFTTDEELPIADLDRPDTVTALIASLRASGAAPWRTDAVAAFSAATSARTAESALLLAGLPDITGYRRIDLTAEQRAVVGLKATEAGNARDQLRAIPAATRNALLAALVPDDPAAWWTTGPDTAAAAAVWHKAFGNRLRVPDDVAADAGAARVADHQLDLALNPADAPAFARRTTQRLNDDKDLVAEDPQAVPGSTTLHALARAIAFLAYRLPYGDPLRAALPGALALARERLADPGLLVDLGLSWAERGGATSAALREAEALPATGGADADGLVRIGDKIVLTPWYGETEHVWVRTGALTGPDDPDLARLQALTGEGRSSGIASLRAVLATGPGTLDHLASTGADGPVGCAQDPTWSVPDLVEEVAKTHDLTADAAALYLQLLALPDPTDRNTARWTGWKPARLKAARAALAATDLVVTAKRARASRSLFLPGGWHEMRTALPLETWKGGLYPVHDGSAIFPDRPVVDLFRHAWQRVQEGDAPGFEQLQTRTTRRGRRR